MDLRPQPKHYGTPSKTPPPVPRRMMWKKFQYLTGSTAENLSESSMPIKKHGIIIETPTEARQAEPGPSVLALLAISTCLVVLILGGLWFAFFRT
jgi:hypothetical protein